MKTSPKPIAMVSVMFVAGAGGCALIGYNFSDYQAPEDGAGGAGGDDVPKDGAGGGAGTSTGGSGGAGTGGASTSSTSASGSDTCSTDCKDANPCTMDSCVSGSCVNAPMSACCAHSVCVAGVALLKGSCVPPGLEADCVSEVCGMSPDCCQTGWNEKCVSLAQQYCKSPSATSLSCTCSPHTPCVMGAALSADCDPCVAAVCKSGDPLLATCCITAWSDTCVAAMRKVCQFPADALCP